MSFFASKRYQRVTNFAFAAILVISAFTASVPFLFSKTADAAPGVSYTSTALSQGDWTVDRTTPSGGWGVDTAGSRVILNVNQTHANTSATFYQTEGVSKALAAGTDSIKADVYVAPDWATKPSLRVGLWAVARDAGNTDLSYPIIEFANIGGYTGWRVWNTNDGTWHNVSAATAAGQYTVEIVSNFKTGDYDFYVNNAKVYSYSADGYLTLTSMIFNNYNAATGNTAGNYTVAWKNISTGHLALSASTNLTLLDGSHGYSTIPTGVIAKTVTSGSTDLTWTAPTGHVNHYLVQTYKNGIAFGTPSWVGTPNSWVQVGNNGDGIYTYGVTAYDNQGVAGATATSAAYIWDHTAPVVTVTPMAGSVLSGSVTFHTTQIETNPGRMYVELDQMGSNGKWQKIANSGYVEGVNTVDLNVDTTHLSDNGQYQIKVSTDDKAGNHGAFAAPYTVDNTTPNAPTGLHFSANGTTLTNLTTKSVMGNNIVLDWTDPTNSPSGINQHITQVDGPNGYTNQFWNGYPNTWLNKNGGEFGQHGDGAYTYKVMVRNAAGTWSAWSAPLTLNYDTKAPTVSNIHMSPQVNNNIGRTTTITFDLTDATGIDLTKTRVLFADGPNSAQAALESAKYVPVFVSGNTYKVVVDTTSFLKLNYTGRYTLALSLYDTVGNHTSTKPVDSRNILVDNSGPSATLAAPTNGSTVSGSQRFSFTIVDDTQVASAYVKFNGPTSKQFALVHGTGNEWYVDVDTATNFTDGSYTLDVRPTDIFGTARYNANRGQVAIDNTAPAAPIVSATGLNSGDSTKQSSVTANWTAPTDAVKYDYKVWTDISTSPYDSEASAYINHNLTSTSRTGTFTEGQGSYFFQVRAYDAAGNASPWSNTFTVVYDTTAPAVSVTAANVATNQPVITGTVDSDADHVNVTILDVNQNVVESGTATYTAGNTTWSYATQTPLVNGTYTVFARAYDAVGNYEDNSADVVVAVTAPAGPVNTAITPASTPLITPASAAAVLGATDTADQKGDTGIKGATDDKTLAAAANTEANKGTIFGLAWYWWILILAALALIAWYVVGAIRRRDENQA